MGKGMSPDIGCRGEYGAVMTIVERIQGRRSGLVRGRETGAERRHTPHLNPLPQGARRYGVAHSGGFL